MFIKKKLVEIFIDRCWSATWVSLQWTVHARYECRLFGFIKWSESCKIAGPFHYKQEAKREAKRLRHKHNL